MVCRYCGQEVTAGATNCPKCGKELNAATVEARATIKETESRPVQLSEDKGMSVTSLVLGALGLLAWYIPVFGVPVGVLGLIIGILGQKKGGRGMAITGIILCSITIVAAIVNAALGRGVVVR